MTTSILEKCKTAVERIGERLPAKGVYAIEAALNYLILGKWMSLQGFRPAAWFTDRDDAFELAARQIAHRSVLYLEFGVWKGDSMRCWSKLLTNPASALHGFDSFEGLPDDWSFAYPKGAFSVAGKIPDIDDSRVQFFKGWFEDTLPDYQLPKHDVMFVNCDADLYSSTKTILTYIGPHLRPGDYLYFDEFHHGADERRAFSEFVKSSECQFSLAACSQSKSQVLFILVSRPANDSVDLVSRSPEPAASAMSDRWHNGS